MKLPSAIKFFGILDLAYLCWAFVDATIKGKIFLISDAITAYEAAKAFENYVPFLISGLGFVLVLSMFYSGYMMLKLSPKGVYLSLFHAPFRFMLVIPPTFFFISWMKAFLGVGSLFFTVIIFALEMMKLTIEIIWCKSNVKREAINS